MSIKSKVFLAARDGKLEKLKNCIISWNKDEVAQLVGAKTHNSTPLVMACRNGHFDVAEYLISECGADVNQPGSVVFDGETIERAPPLWCAAAAGHLALVRLLVANGANVNAMTKTNSTPIRAACYDGHLDIAKFLVDHGADIEVTNRHGHTCLMIACYKGHLDIVKFLLSLKADANRKSLKGNTALHDCAESGSLEVMQVLIKHGARMDVDMYGMTPLLTAAATGHTHIVEYLVGLTHLTSRKDRIDALELLGATYVDKKRDMIRALEFWARAIEERYRGDGPVMAKPSPPPLVAAYDFAREISDVEQLNDLLADPDQMRMQALVIRERILGPAHPDTSYYIRYRGALYADAGKFGRCIELWHYALDMQQSMLEPLNPMTHNSLVSFTELFSFIIGRAHRVPPTERGELLRVFRKAVLEVKSGKQMLDKIPASEQDLTYLDRMLVTTLHLACLLTRDLPEEGTEEYTTLYKTLYELVRIGAKSRMGRDVLQLAHCEDYVMSRKYWVSMFPSPYLTQALLKVGADVTAKDIDGNTALHLTALSKTWRPEVAVALLEANAHIDAVNNEDKTFEMLLDDKAKFATVNPMKYTTLACLAGRVVRRTRSMDSVPKHLVPFVKMHSAT